MHVFRFRLVACLAAGWIDSYSPTWLLKGKPESIML